MSVADLIKKLAICGISSNRKTLYEDIEVLKEYGLDIYTFKNKGTANMYHLASRDFELPELKLLVDTIQFSHFLTPRKSKELICKLTELTSIYQANQLARSVIFTDEMKCLNESIYYTIDSIHNAVLKKKKIAFKYFSHTIDKKKEYRNSGNQYIVSPYTMACSNNNYYLIAFHEKYKDYSQFRIDRMEKVEVLDQPRYELSEGFKMEKYIQKVFRMYSGELKEIEIVFDNSLINTAIDRFGKNAFFTKVDDGHFKVCTTLSISPTFFSWLFQFGDKARLTAPQDVRDELIAHAEGFMNNL
ncbi:MAG: WYL domain-containing protein [Clostridiales bacterium]|nr:WYL domain-containing protein [Clostridiales bacterium]